MAPDESVTVKGSPVRSLQKFVQAELTEAQRETVLRALPPEYANRLRGPVLPMQPPRTLAQITKNRVVSTARPGPTTWLYQPGLSVPECGSATYWSSVSAWQTSAVFDRAAFGAPSVLIHAMRSSGFCSVIFAFHSRSLPATFARQWSAMS